VSNVQNRQIYRQEIVVLSRARWAWLVFGVCQVTWSHVCLGGVDGEWHVYVCVMCVLLWSMCGVL
jgi:hypothetical protein